MYADETLRVSLRRECQYALNRSFSLSDVAPDVVTDLGKLRPQTSKERLQAIERSWTANGSFNGEVLALTYRTKN